MPKGLLCYGEKMSPKKLALFAVALSALAFAQDRRIPAGSKIYVEAEKGFDTYITAALDKKKVPLVVVADKEKADFVLAAASSFEEKSFASKVFLGHRDSSDATMKLVNVKSGEVVFAYSVHKKNSARGNQSTAEACAKHLKEAMEKR
jgi:hypothetical protein